VRWGEQLWVQTGPSCEAGRCVEARSSVGVSMGRGGREASMVRAGRDQAKGDGNAERCTGWCMHNVGLHEKVCMGRCAREGVHGERCTERCKYREV